MNREKEKKNGGKGLAGGGLAIGALHEINPVFMRQGDDDTECLSIEIVVGNRQIRCVAGYGPQLGDSIERKESFWRFLDEETKSAQESDVGIIIQMDSNAWAGPDIIPSDPNKQNANGKLMEKFLKENPALIVVNSLKCCERSITRQRTSILGEKKTLN